MYKKTRSFFTKRAQFLTMPLYAFFIISMLVLSWEAHFFYPNYAGASTLAVVSMNESSQADFIPEESIRLRIKSNSNSAVDQQVKINIRDEVNRHISEWTSTMTDLADARHEIETRMPELETVIMNELEKLGKKTSFRVSLADVDFPTKQYGNRVYPAGEYEAVFIELGDGLGDNWWCVLFPPLCFVDFAEGSDQPVEVDQEEEEEEEEVQISFFVVDVVQSLWGKITGA
ncbi:stage II sporulation protein R [Salipaludibacillus keqinensis]|nr:stage II sporulation protein R [Salipaludibacillus keqinensis]